MKQYTLYYSVRNGGDGSAYPKFMESEQLCRWDQDHMSEGWGESCDGSFTLESESDIFPVSKVATKESYFIEKYVEDYDAKTGFNEEAQEFLCRFFPEGLPKFTVEIEKATKGYWYNKVFANGKLVAKIFMDKESSGKKFEDLLNNLKV